MKMFSREYIEIPFASLKKREKETRWKLENDESGARWEKFREDFFEM